MKKNYFRSEYKNCEVILFYKKSYLDGYFEWQKSEQL